MRLGLNVLWDSLVEGSTRTFHGVVRCFEHDKGGKAIVECEPDGKWLPIARSRLRVAKVPAKFTAKGGGDNPESSATLIAEVA